MKEVHMYPPIPEQLSFRLKSSMYKLKSIDEIIPPCLTPFVTHKLVEHVLPQRTNILCREYQKTSNLIMNNGTPFLIILLNSNQWSIRIFKYTRKNVL